MLRGADWTPESERWEFARRRMFEEPCDVQTLHERIRHLLATWPANQGAPPVPLQLMDRALGRWDEIRAALAAADEVRQVDIAKQLGLDPKGQEALSYLMYVLSGCGVVKKRTLKNRVRLQLQSEEIDLESLKAHWRDAWASRTTFDLTRPMYRDLDPNDHDALADYFCRDGRRVFSQNASAEAIDALNAIQAELKPLLEAADGQTAFFYGDLPRSWQRILSWLESEALMREMHEKKAMTAVEMKPRSRLRIEIASPCPASWDDMEGDERVRFCSECALNVYNISAMTENEARALVEEHEGRLCVRFYQREDGTVLTRDCPVGAGKPLPGTYVGRMEGDPW